VNAVSAVSAPPRLAHGPADTADLLKAILAISGELDLRSLLRRIAQAAADLTNAQNAALGVIGSTGELDEFVTVGIDDETQARIGPKPRGQGLLGLLIDDPRPLRLRRIQDHPASAGVPVGHPEMTTFLGVPIMIRGTAFGNLYLTDKQDGAEFDATDEALVEALANAAGLVIDNARSYWFSERRRQWLQASAALARAIQPPMPLEESLQLTVERARAAAGAQMAAILQFPSGSHPVIAAADTDPTLDPIEVIRAVVADAKWVDQESTAIEVDLGDRHALVVPLRAHLSEPGALVVVVGELGSSILFDEQGFLAEFADQAALAVDRAQAVIDREDLAVLADRERIARDLHDHVIQRLFATGLRLNLMRSLDDRASREQELNEAIDALDLTIRDIRTTIFGLTRPLTGSLSEVLEEVLSSYAPLLGRQPNLDVVGDLEQIPAEVVENLRAVLREALSNVAQHAAADNVDVELAVTAQTVTLRVSDDGVGIDNEPRHGGLRNAAERARLLGGSLGVTTAPSTGTVLTWSVPRTPADR